MVFALFVKKIYMYVDKSAMESLGNSRPSGEMQIFIVTIYRLTAISNWMDGANKQIEKSAVITNYNKVLVNCLKMESYIIM